MRQGITWFEIPVEEMDRAVHFYNMLLGIQFERTQELWATFAGFPVHDGVGGALVKGDDFVPGSQGPVIYLYAGDDLSSTLGRVEAAGGRVALPKTSIGEYGVIAFVIDSEGNRIGLHSPQ